MTYRITVTNQAKQQLCVYLLSTLSICLMFAGEFIGLLYWNMVKQVYTIKNWCIPGHQKEIFEGNEFENLFEGSN